MKIIFLDIDGVLCTLRGKLSVGAGLPSRTNHHHQYLDPAACGLLAQLIAEFDAKIVISSTWRKRGKSYVVRAFEESGQQVISDALHCTWSTPVKRGIRGDEIACMLSKAEGVSHYLILDDDSDMRQEQEPHLVLTNGYNGMSAGDYLQARQVLGATDLEPDSEHLFKWNDGRSSVSDEFLQLYRDGYKKHLPDHGAEE